MPNIYPKKINNKTYYYYQYTYREKVDQNCSGKTRGSGESKVRTVSVFLGTAQSIFEQLNKIKKPIEVTYKEFGVVAAGYQVAKEIGLCEILQKYIPGVRFEIPRWIFFLITILNRLDNTSSKEQIGKWTSKTILPQLLNFAPKYLNSKTFWYATDDIINEKELKERRKQNPDIEDELCAGLYISVFEKIENELWPKLYELIGKSVETLLYDITNFFTYIEEPVSSLLAKKGHNKESRHHLRQVGLAMVVEKEWGLPLFHRLYRGNTQDSKTFSYLISELIGKIKDSFNEVNDIVLVLDKGNNSEANFEKLQGKVNWIGSLIPSRYNELIDKDLSEYTGYTAKHKYYKKIMSVMGIECIVLVTYNEDLYRKQEHTLYASIDKLKKKLQDKFDSYKRRPASIPQGIGSMLKQDRYGIYLNVSVKDKKLVFTEVQEEILLKRKSFGKNIIFTNKLDAEPVWIISQYKNKERIEDDFKLLKTPELIRFRPIRHWTDTKIYALGFCCIMSLVLLKVMQIKAEYAGLKMSPLVLKEELKDMKEIIMIYSKDHAEMQISKRSSVQQKLWELFKLVHIEKAINHTPFE